MREPRRAIRLAITLALAASVLGAVASSALAVSIEPLSTKFSGANRGGTTAIWHFGGESEGPQAVCSKATLTGTTNSTKTNYVNATPEFLECKYETKAVTFTNSCSKEGTIPWTTTLGEAKTFSVKANCGFVEKIGAVCTMTASEQTATSESAWKNVESVNLELISGGLLFSSVKSSGCGSVIGSNPTALSLTDNILIKGIHAA